MRSQIGSRINELGAIRTRAGRWELPMMLVVFALLRVLAAIHSPLSYPDTASYHALNFLGGSARFWTVPVLWKVFPTNGLREAAQILIGIAAWSTLACSVDGCLTRTWLRRGAVAVVLMLGLVPQVTGWDGTLLAQSVSTSMLVLLTALLLRLTRSQSRRLLAATLLAATFWIFARDVNVLLYLATLPFVCLFAIRRLSKPTAWLVAVALLGIALWGAFAITRPGDGTVWKRNALYIVMDRIAHHPSAFRFFTSRGLPTAVLTAQAQVSFDTAADRLSRDPRVVGWIDHRFRKVYLAYLMRHLPGAIETALARGPAYVSTPLPFGKARSVLPNLAEKAIWGDSSGPILVCLLLAAALVLIATVSGAEVSALPLVALLVLTAGIGSVLVWYLTDPVMVLGRQFMPVAVSLRLGVLLGAAFSIDALAASVPAWLRRRRSWPAGHAPTSLRQRASGSLGAD